MKKYLMIILAFVLVLALLAGCAPKETAEPTDPVVQPTGTQGQVEPEPPTGLEAAEITVQVENEWRTTMRPQPSVSPMSIRT